MGWKLSKTLISTESLADNLEPLPDPLRPRPREPLPSPFRPPGQYLGPQEELGRILKEILEKLTVIENRLKAIEEQLKTKR